MKSAYELAMERLRKQEGEVVPLTDEQKAALREVESETKAKIAQIEISSDAAIAAAKAAGKFDEVQALQQQRVDDLRRARERGDREKEEIRKSGSAR